MAVTAKFRVTSINYFDQSPGDPIRVVTLNAVTTGKGNEAWSKYTPNGKIEMTITNPEATLALGCEYFVTFTDVGPEPANS